MTNKNQLKREVNSTCIRQGGHTNTQHFASLFKSSIVLTLLILSGTSYGQLTGYGNGVNGTESLGTGVSMATDIFFAESAYSAVSSVSGGVVQLSGTTVGTGAKFDPTAGSADYKALIIQMVGGTVGTHESFDFASLTGTTLVVAGGTLTHTYDFTAGSKVQVLLVPQYTSFTLAGGNLTCPAWDGDKGGILAFTVSGTMTVTGGRINTTGKGYIPGGVTFATGGSGGTGSTTYGGGGGNPGRDGILHCVAPGYTALNRGPAGASGDPACATCVGTAGSSSSGLPGDAYGSSSFTSPSGPFLFKIGDAGYFVSGYGSGEGGDGGSHSGAGGGAGTGWTPGNPGGNSDAGGDAGAGAAGGSSIYIKAGYIMYPTTALNYPIYLAEGGNGKNGKYGGAGGKGGNGGSGSTGSCTLMEGTAGYGGNGISGAGGEGGDGANGGNAGTIWVLTNTGVGNYVNSYTRTNGGYAGAGGPGGSSTGPGTGISAPVAPCEEACPPPPCGATKRDIDICDCDKAHEFLFNIPGLSVIDNLVDTRYEFRDGLDLRGWYDYSTQRVVGISYGNNSTGVPHCNDYYYNCPMTGEKLCNAIYKQVAQLSTTDINTNIDPSSIVVDIPSIYETNVYFWDDQGNEAIKFLGGSVEETTDHLSSGKNKCVSVPCVSGPNKGKGRTGIPGIGSPIPNNVELPIITPNVVITGGNSPFSIGSNKPRIAEENQHHVTIGLNEITIASTDDTKEDKIAIVKVLLLDVNGRNIELIADIAEEMTTLHNFDVSTGIYYLRIISNNGRIETHKLYLD